MVTTTHPNQNHKYYSNLNKINFNPIPSENLDSDRAEISKMIDSIHKFNQQFNDYVNCKNNKESNCKPPTNLNINTKISSIDYQKNKNDIENYYKNILSLRQELDMKLNSLNNTNHSFYNDSKMELSSSVYSGILWTILASSIIYFIIVRD